jgi:hypothetical protein
MVVQPRRQSQWSRLRRGLGDDEFALELERDSVVVVARTKWNESLE